MLSLKEYYDKEETLKEILGSVQSPQWRVWKVEDINGVFRQNTKKINSTKKLRRFLGDQPSKVYVSVAQFLQPTKVFGKTPRKSQYVIADSLFIKSDLLFDFDHDDMRVALKDVKKTLKFMKTQEDYKLVNVRLTNRGYHVLYEDLKPVKEAHPVLRREKTEIRRKALVKKMPRLETIDKRHKAIIADQFRVHAALGTIKADTGYKIKKITCFDTEKHNQRRVVRPAIRSMIKDDSFILTSTKGKEGSTLTSYPHTYNFIDNMVCGAKQRYVTVLKYPRGKRVAYRKLQKDYKLSHFFKFEYKNVDIYINFKTVSKERLIKIMRAAKPMNLNSFEHYGHAWIPLTETRDSKGGVVWKKPILTKIIHSRYGLNDVHSRPHCNMLEISFDNMIGRLTNKLCQAVITDKHGGVVG